MRLLKICGLALVLAAISYSAVLAEPFQGYINSDNINCRADSTASAEIVCELAKGTQVSVIKEQYDWYKIRLPKSAPSYVKKNLLECLPEETPKTSQTPIPLNQRFCHSAKVIADNVNIRLKPDQGAKILGRLNKNVIVSVLGEEKGWFKIEPVENSHAWVHKKFVNTEFVKVASKAAEKDLSTKIDRPIPEQVIIEGIVMPYGKIFNRSATHKLLTPDKRVFLLKGNKPGLDALNYHKVKITGKVLESLKGKHPVIEITSTEALN